MPGRFLESWHSKGRTVVTLAKAAVDVGVVTATEVFSAGVGRSLAVFADAVIDVKAAVIVNGYAVDVLVMSESVGFLVSSTVVSVCLGACVVEAETVLDFVIGNELVVSIGVVDLPLDKTGKAACVTTGLKVGAIFVAVLFFASVDINVLNAITDGEFSVLSENKDEVSTGDVGADFPVTGVASEVATDGITPGDTDGNTVMTEWVKLVVGNKGEVSCVGDAWKEVVMPD
ncbi:UNVERIFIED_CONTAM: hypothetical protein K2H54_058129 [Gekko kuhli]